MAGKMLMAIRTSGLDPDDPAADMRTLMPAGVGAVLGAIRDPAVAGPPARHQ